MQLLPIDPPRPRRTALTFATIAGVLVVLHVLAMLVYYQDWFGRERIGLHRWHVSIFDLDEEESFGTWLSAVMLLLAGRILLYRARVAKARAEPMRLWWLVLAIGFHFLSIDEVVGLHEYLNSMLENTPWTVYGAAVAGVVGLAYLPFLWRMGWWTGGLFALAGAIYLGGAVGVEHATEWYADENLLSTLPYNLWTAVEEALEMGGVILFLYALLDHVKTLQEAKRR
jgi:hypothetical protein